MRLDCVSIVTAFGATGRLFSRSVVRLNVITAIRIVRFGVAAAPVEVGQNFVRCQMHIIDAIAINFDRRVQRAARFGEVDALSVWGMVPIFVGHTCRATLVLFVVIVSQEQVNIFNKFQIPRVSRVNFVFRIHANGFLVEFREIGTRFRCRAAVRSTSRLYRITTAVETQKTRRRTATIAGMRREQRRARGCHTGTGRTLALFFLVVVLVATSITAADAAMVVLVLATVG